jgi:hypothetical protein
MHTTPTLPATPVPSRPKTRLAMRRAHALWLYALALSLALPTTAASPADAPVSRHDHDWALQAVRAGEIRSVPDILQRLEREFLGHVVEIELERERGRIVYEIELLAPSGHVLELVYDARTAVLVSARGQGVDGARRQASALGAVRP